MDSNDVSWGTTIPEAGVVSVNLEGILAGLDAETDYEGVSGANAHPADPDMMAGATVSRNLYETFGAFLRALRCEAELTLDQVAIAVGVAKPSVWAWENGRSKPTREKWYPLARVLGISPQVLASAAKAETLNKAALPVLRVEEVEKIDRAAMLAAGREMIAKACGVTPSAVRITVEL
jgi:transcriptional regulator with XRE-family HTH domain